MKKTYPMEMNKDGKHSYVFAVFFLFTYLAYPVQAF
jgi:hypothetical protein